MSELIVSGSAPPATLSSEQMDRVLIQGDLSKLNEEQRVGYFKAVCDSLGLNPLTKPFEFIHLGGKLVLYAKRDATDQLRRIYGVSVAISARERIGDVYVVTARAQMPNGRQDESTGAVHLGSAKGEVLANLFMKAETKAKRRATLSICGLGLLDETEVETVPDARPLAQQMPNMATTKAISQSAEPEYIDLPASEKELTGTDEDLGNYKIKVFSKHQGKLLKDVDLASLQVTIDHYNTQKELNDMQKEFLMAAEGYLNFVKDSSGRPVK